jgi:hypothetical protein
MRFVVLLAWLLATLPATAEHRRLPPEEQISGSSQLVMGMLEAAPPADARDALATALVLDYAHELDFRALRRHVERKALHAILGTEPPPAPRHVSDLAAREPGAKADEELRMRVLAAVHREPPAPDDASVASQVPSMDMRHDQGAVWTQMLGPKETKRVIGVSFRNDSALPMFRGEMGFAPPGLGEFSCNVGAVPAHGASPYLCWAYGPVPPLADVYRSLQEFRDGAAPKIELRKAVFLVDGMRFEVTRENAHYVAMPPMDDEVRARDVIARTPCADKGTCMGGFLGSVGRSPFMLGLVAGAVAGAFYLFLLFGFGERAADTGRKWMVALGVAAAVVVMIGVVIWSARLGPLYGFVVTGVAAGAIMEGGFGFLLGLAIAVVIGVVNGPRARA